jgi:AcrR family transcriptional regulator
MEKLSRTAQRTKNKILESALTLFKERGYNSVTIDEITQKAEVAKGSFYTYFSTKSDIVVEEFWQIDNYYVTYASKNLHKYATAREKLLAFTRAQMRHVRDVVGNSSLKILYANQAEQPGSQKMITNQERQWHKIIRAIIQEGQDKGEFRTDLSADRLALLFNRSARGIFLDWCVQDAAFDLVKEGVAVMRDFVITALQHPKE